MPTLRFLCLHGSGTNSSILRAQLGPLMQELANQNDASFHFIEGSYPSSPGAGVSDISEGPYLDFYPWPRTVESDESQELGEAIDFIYQTIEEEGPFDGILGFSHGATLAFQFLVHQAKTNAYTGNIGFRCAVFISGMAPFRLITMGDGAEDTASNNSFEQNIVSLKKDSSLAQSLLSEKRGSRTALLDGGMEDLVDIPSLHIVGSEDEICDLSLRLYRLCQKDKSTLLNHNHGHQVPRDRNTVLLMAGAFRKLSWQASFGW